MKNIVRQRARNETAAANAKSLAGRSNRRTEVRIVRGLDDLLMVYSIRASVYMAEQDCPFVEESTATIIARHISSALFGESLLDVFARDFLVTL
jgi:hypothetical protein